MAESDSEAQARGALALAEQHFLAGDVAGARHHALGLAPGLPGAEQALAAYDVHAAFAASAGVSLGLGALPRWYAVLFLPYPWQQLSGSGGGGGVTHDDVKRHHRRLCLLVHPDKNPSAAADGAFKLVQAAYAALLPIHPPPPPRDEEKIRFWEEAKYDEIAPLAARLPPIARPQPQRVALAPAAPPPPEAPIRLPCCLCQPPCVFARWYATAAEGSRSSGSAEGCVVVDNSSSPRANRWLVRPVGYVGGLVGGAP